MTNACPDHWLPRRLARGFAAALCASLLGTPGLAIAASASVEDAKSELADTLAKLNALEVWLSDAEKKRALWQQEIQSADREVARLGLKVAELRNTAKAVEATQAELAREAITLAAKRQTEGERIAEHLNAAYRMSDQDFFKLLLNQETPEKFDRMIRYHQYFSKERGKLLQGYRATLTAIELNQSKAAEAQETLRRQRSAAAEEQQVFVAQKNVRKELIAKLYSTSVDKQAEQERLRKNSQRLKRLLQQLANNSQQTLEKTLDKTLEKTLGREFAARKGKLGWPAEGKLKNGFGEPRADGRLKWQGSYIETEPGEVIRAVHRGKVVFAEWLRGFGLLTIVDHSNGYLSLYGYADVLLKEPGDRVESGEQIANSGRSGGQDSDGLYFEIRKDGSPLNPSQWLFTPSNE